jgi:alginate O-acetyltransferase complex protein AlgI
MSVLDSEWLVWILGLVLASWLTPPSWRPLSIAGITLVAIALHDVVSASLLAAMALVTTAVGRSARENGLAVRIATAVILLLGVLAAFKVMRNQDVVGVMPLGMSYYTFRCVHYLLERLKRRLPPHTLAEFLAYIFFLPTFSAGPIHRFGQFHRDLRRRPQLTSLVSEGLERILYGYAKIVIVANFLVERHLRTLAATVADSSPRIGAYLDMLAGGFNGYMQFAGYSDIAIGAALLCGFRVMENFNNPFAARNIIDFWRRWHISLTSWVRDYLYTSVFSVTRRPYLAALVTMLAIGLWHEISWRYVIWGLSHGAAVALCQAYQRRFAGPGPATALGTAVSWFATFHFVMLSFVLVQHDFSGALALYRLLVLGAA